MQGNVLVGIFDREGIVLQGCRRADYDNGLIADCSPVSYHGYVGTCGIEVRHVGDRAR